MAPRLIERLLRSKNPLACLRSLAVFLALPSALAVASYAQYAIGQPAPGWMTPFSRINEELTRIYQRPQSVLLAFALFVGAGVLFVVATRRGHRGGPPELWPVLNSATLWQGGWGDKLCLSLFLGGAALWGYLVAQLWFGGYGDMYPLLFGLSLLGLAAPFVRLDVLANLRPRFALHWWEPPLVVAFAATLFVLNVRDLDA